MGRYTKYHCPESNYTYIAKMAVILATVCQSDAKPKTHKASVVWYDEGQPIFFFYSHLM